MAGDEQSIQLAAPDWGALDTLRKSSLPFILWEVGDQPLLAHWLDEAFNRGCQVVYLDVADRPAQVREYCRGASLWPLEIHVRSVSKIETGEDAILIDHLPWEERPTSVPGGDWDLLEYWWQLQLSWFSHNRDLLADPGNFLSIGRHCQIHPSAKLVEPYWIGDQVSIGPGCVIGPHALIGHRCMLAGYSHISASRVGANTYLAPDTEPNDGILEGSRLFNRRLQALVDQLDAVIAGELEEKLPGRTSLWDRLRALRLYLRFKSRAGRLLEAGKVIDVETVNGLKCHVLDSPDSFVARWPLYGSVIRGTLPLVGIPPYDCSELADIDAEWKACLRNSAAGVFGLSDPQSNPETPLEERIVHDVYQATCGADEAIRTIVNNYIRNRLARSDS